MDPFYLAILLYFLALVLATIDLFVPSGGMLVVLAGLAAFACILFGFRAGHWMGMSMIALVAASIPAFAVIAIRVWPHTPIGRRVILRLPSSAGDTDRNEIGSGQGQSLLGKVFVAQSPIMPSGHLRVGGRDYNIVAESGYIEAGERLKIIGFRERNWIARVTDEPLSVLDTPQPKEVDTDDAPARSLLDVPADELGLDSIDDDTVTDRSAIDSDKA